MLVDVTVKGFNGKQVQELLDKVKITVNKNTIPFDKESPFKGSGVRLGTPAVTTRGMKEKEMELIAELITETLRSPEDEGALAKVRARVEALTEKFPLYPGLMG